MDDRFCLFFLSLSKEKKSILETSEIVPEALSPTPTCAHVWCWHQRPIVVSPCSCDKWTCFSSLTFL